MIKSLSICLLFCFTLISYGQTTPNLFDFTQISSVKVIHNGDSLLNAWSGGLNYAQINTIDLNGDNVDDLAVFDRNTRQVLTFVRVGNSFVYDPQYRSAFPNPNSWMMLRDFNCDGKKDVFFNIGSDVRVWENISTAGKLEFADASKGPIQTLYSGNPTKNNLYISAGDIPGIADIDGDGSIDIVNFDGGGIIVEFHTNSDTCGLDYILKERCWGHFSETGIYRSVELDGCVPFKKKTLHSGSSILPLDLNSDNVIDVILGNISYSDMGALYNGGTPDSAHFTSQDTLYPTYDRPVELTNFPAGWYEDVTFDGIPDLIVSSADQSDGGQDKRSVQLYKNNGTTTSPIFNYVKNNFLQEDMLDLGKGAVPRLVDMNGDSLLDLVVANNHNFVSLDTTRHYYQYYINTGNTNNPEFTLVDSNFANISSYPGLEVATVPCFGDLDNDGDLDMIVGDQNGKLYYFTNSSATAPNFTFAYAFPGIDVNNNAAPFLYDIDGDGDLDLLVGNFQGKVYLYKNSSITSPSFTLATDNYGAISTATGGYGGNSVPIAFEENGFINVMVGSDYKGILQYDSVAYVSSKPSELVVIVGTDSNTTGGADFTPYGISKRAGKNQYLYRASELRAQGLEYGYINSIEFDVTTSNNGTLFAKYSVKIKATTDSSLSGFVSGFTEVHQASIHPISKGWNITPFDRNRFLWDGVSNIVIEVCYHTAANVNNNALVNLTDVGYGSNAYGQYVDVFTGCDQLVKGVTSKRPNIRFRQTPAFRQTGTYANGYRTAPAVADLDNDGYIDLITGTWGGGLYYYQGKKYNISTPEPEKLESKSLNVYPNPGTGIYTIEIALDSDNQLSVFDLTGKLIISRSITERQSKVNLSNQPAGIYIFMVQNSEGIKTQKVIKQ